MLSKIDFIAENNSEEDIPDLPTEGSPYTPGHKRECNAAY